MAQTHPDNQKRKAQSQPGKRIWWSPFQFDRSPEPSGRLRALAAGTQVVGMTAQAMVTNLWPVWVISMLMLVAGHVYAHRVAGRENRPRWPRVLAFIAFHLVFCWLFAGLFIGQPYPQAQFAMLATGLVSMEIFSRMNLNAAIGLGVTNLYVAATLSRGYTFLFFLLAYLVLWLAYLWLADSLDGGRQSAVTVTPPPPPTESTRPRPRFGWTARFALLLVLAAPFVFLFTPQPAGRPLFMPMTFRLPVEQEPSANVINPAVPLVQIQGEVNRGESEYYFGFADQIDLSYRGGLSDTVMMLVKSQAWSYWRGYALDHYDGRNWEQSDEQIERIRGGFDDNVFDVDPDAPAWGGEWFVQSFYIMQDMPNIVWAGGRPFRAYVASQELGQDSTGGLRLGSALQRGMTYSIISNRIDADPATLHATDGGAVPPEIREIYLQLPDTVTDRTRVLATTWTADAETDYDRVIAIRDELLKYEYDFYPPPQPPNTDAVDLFLFEDQRGVCEHYVSSMVVLLRVLGIPSRFVVGYGAGDYNPLSGYYTVRANDAHAWTEVYFPGMGWVPFDPTPGWNGAPQTGPVDTFIFSSFLKDTVIPRIPTEQLSAAGLAVLGWVGGIIVPLLLTVLLAGMGVGAWWLWRRIARSRPRRYHTDAARRRVFRAYRWATFWRRIRRTPGQTVREQLADQDDLQALREAVEVAAYRPEPPTEDEIRQARE